MNYNDFKNSMSEEGISFKNGDHVQFATDQNSKAHQYVGKVFEMMKSQNSNSQLLPTNLGQKVVFNIHKDDVAKVFYCLDRIYQKTKDNDIINWVNDIKYHLMHSTKQKNP
jgi:hypothetical protein